LEAESGAVLRFLDSDAAAEFFGPGLGGIFLCYAHRDMFSDNLHQRLYSAAATTISIPFSAKSKQNSFTAGGT
jgi:hypothetical protein